LFLCDVKVAAHHRDKKVLKDPLQQAPPDELVFESEMLGVLVAGVELHPGDVFDSELVKNGYPRKTLISVEINKLVNFGIENLLVFTRWQECLGHNLEKDFAQKV